MEKSYYIGPDGSMLEGLWVLDTTGTPHYIPASLAFAAPVLLAACQKAIETIDDDAPGPGCTEKQLLALLRSAVAVAERV